MITERENALRTIRRTDTPEWVPISSKCFYFLIPSAIMERPKGGDGMDWFGCKWVYDEATVGYAEDFREGAPLKDVTKWREVVQFPDLDAIDWEGCAKKDLENFDREQQIMEIFWESGPFERTHHLLGMEEAFYAMYDEPEVYKEFIEAITDWRIDAMGRLIDAYKPDLIYTHDDLGSSVAPLLNPVMYREFVKPSHYKQGWFIRSKDVLVTQHSCGMMQDFVGDMLDCGAQVINPLQGMNDQKTVLEKYGDKVSVHGGLKPMIYQPSSTEEELRAEVRRAIDLFAPYRNLILDTFAFPEGFTEILTDEAEHYGNGYWKRHGM